jgi:NAD(P)H-hydrate epimerase
MNTVLTREQIRRVDELAIARYRIPGLILMENAGRNAAAVIVQEFGPGGKAVIFCGGGNNGGDGLVIARLLHNSLWRTRVVALADLSKLTPDASVNFRIVRAMGIPIVCVSAANDETRESIMPEKDEIVIDALLGTGFQGVVRRPMAELIEALNTTPKRATIAIDIPSGMDCDTGVGSNATIRADLTITFVAEKTGFLRPGSKEYTGRVVTADIGAPRELIAEVCRPEGTSTQFSGDRRS